MPEQVAVVADPAAAVVTPVVPAVVADPAVAVVADPAKPVVAPDAAKLAGDDAAKKAADKAAADKVEADAKAAKPVIPDTYEFKPPEGVTFNPEMTTKVSEFGKKYGLTQDAMNELVGFGGDMGRIVAEANAGVLAKARDEWTVSSKSDKEFGGATFDANLAQANLVFETFGTPELKQLLVDSGLSNHPEMIRWAYRVSKEFSPDRFVPGGKNAAGAKDLASRLYPNHKAA